MDKTLKQITNRKLYRSRDAVIAGVCAGIADYYDMDALVVRILAVLLTLVTFGAAAIAYFVMWANLPLEPERFDPFETAFEIPMLNMQPVGNYYLLPDTAAEKQLAKMPLRGLTLTARMSIVVVLFILYLVLSMNLAPLIGGTSWWQFWPLFLLIVGLFFLIIPIRSRYMVAWHIGGLIVTIISIALLPMSLGVLSWLTVSYTFSLFGPILIVSVLLMALGVWARTDLVTLAGSACFILFCVLGAIYCVIPGTLDASSVPFQLLSTPTIPLLYD